MALVDVIVLIITILLLISIIFFAFILPKIKHENTKCHSCPAIKKAKRTKKQIIKSLSKKEND